MTRTSKTETLKTEGSGKSTLISHHFIYMNLLPSWATRFCVRERRSWRAQSSEQVCKNKFCKCRASSHICNFHSPPALCDLRHVSTWEAAPNLKDFGLQKDSKRAHWLDILSVNVWQGTTLLALCPHGLFLIKCHQLYPTCDSSSHQLALLCCVHECLRSVSAWISAILSRRLSCFFRCPALWLTAFAKLCPQRWKDVLQHVTQLHCWMWKWWTT